MSLEDINDPPGESPGKVAPRTELSKPITVPIEFTSTMIDAALQIIHLAVRAHGMAVEGFDLLTHAALLRQALVTARETGARLEEEAKARQES